MVLLAASVVSTSNHPVSAYQQVTSGGCLNCHAFAGGTSSVAHTTHSNVSVGCTACHAVPGAKDVTSSKCIACHPAGDIGKCNLVNLPAHPESGTQSCLTCHPNCAPATTTTTSIPPGDCIDSNILTIRPKTFSNLRALVFSPIQFFSISADRYSSISFASPISLDWGSPGIKDIIRLRIGEKLIVGFLRIYPGDLTAGYFTVQITYGDISQTTCGLIEVQNNAARTFTTHDIHEDRPDFEQ